MNLKKKMKVTLLVLLALLILLFSASYAWLTLSLAPQITDIDTNVGANGSLEIALLSDTTYLDPQMIRAKIGSSAVTQEIKEANLAWGNVVDLSDPGYGMGQLSLLPARLNLSGTREGGYLVEENMLNVAEFGIDGRISILSPGTVSAVYEEDAFTYYVSGQRYGLRAIGTISHLSAQQKALAGARTQAQSHTAAASRTVKNAWRDHGPGVMDLFFNHGSQQQQTFSGTEVSVIGGLAGDVALALKYTELALRQGIIGMAASRISGEEEFLQLQEMVGDPDIPLSAIFASAGQSIPEPYGTWAAELEEMQEAVIALRAGCLSLGQSNSWEQIEPLLDVLVDGDRVYLGDYRLTDPAAFSAAADDSVLTLAPDSGVMAQMAEFAGNYSAFFRWTESRNVEVRTADPGEVSHLVAMVENLKKANAATGGWTRADLDDTYGYAMDLAFRCNTDSDLLLQTAAAMRVEGSGEMPRTQGGGSYMRFTSEHMDTQQLLQLMDTIRVGFINDQSELIALAKLNTSSYEQQEEGVFAPLYLYRYGLEDDGSLTVGERLKEDPAILPLSRNTPTVLTVVVWLDGDQVDNSHVDPLSGKSMSGVLNLQFSGSADLLPSRIPVEGD